MMRAECVGGGVAVILANQGLDGRCVEDSRFVGNLMMMGMRM